jgi:hypothetical protein
LALARHQPGIGGYLSRTAVVVAACEFGQKERGGGLCDARNGVEQFAVLPK